LDEDVKKSVASVQQKATSCEGTGLIYRPILWIT